MPNDQNTSPQPAPVQQAVTSALEKHREHLRRATATDRSQVPGILERGVFPNGKPPQRD